MRTVLATMIAVLVAACSDGGGDAPVDARDAAAIDAAIDAPDPDAAIDATIDAAIDATIDATIDAVPIDATPAAVSIATVSPPQGPTTGGTTVTLTGAGFAAGATVRVDNRDATVLAAGATVLVFTLPAAPGVLGPVTVQVRNPDSGFATATFRYHYGTIAFAPRVDHATGTEPRGLAVVDLDGDGDLDVATAHRNVSSSNPGLFGVNLNGGGGALGATVQHLTSPLVSTLATGDWNGDGRVDLATVTVTGGGVALLYGTGGGNFGLYDAGNPLHRVPLADALRLAAGDLDGDGDLDLAIGRRNSNAGVIALRNAGNGTFTAATPVPTATQVITIAVGNLDGNTLQDVVAATSASELVVLRSTGSGNFAAPVTYPTGGGVAQSIALVDRDGDGDTDVIATISGAGGVALLDNLGNGTLAPAVLLATPGNNASGAALADLDRDGRLDLAIGNPDGDTLTIRRADGTGYTAGFHVGTGDRPIEVHAGDLDGDGRIDLVVQHDTAGSFGVLRNTSQ